MSPTGGTALQQWHDELAAHFADPKYDADRDAIIEALCSPDPKQRTYTLRLPTVLYGRPATESHFISAGEGGPLIHIFVMPDKEDDPNPESN